MSDSPNISPIYKPKTIRKLSKNMRIENMIYQIFMVIASGITFMVIQLDNNGISIRETVFKVYSVVIGVIPVIWSNILNLFKKNIIEEEQK